MPLRFQYMLTQISVLVYSAITTMASAALAVIADAPTALLDDGKMRLVCVIGAIGGGVLSAIIFTPPKSTGRMFAIKVGSSSLAGILFTPICLHWLGWQANVDMLLGFSAVVALLAIGVIRITVPLWERAAGRYLSPEARCRRETQRLQDDPPQ